MTVIYVDMLLAVNLVIDYLLLCGCARVLHLTTVRIRLIAGAALGALSSLVILLPPMGVGLSLLYKLGSAVLMVPLSFRIRSFCQFLKTTVVLFVISALFAGLCGGIYLLAAPSGLVIQSGVMYVSVPPLLLLSLTVVSYGILCLYDRFTARRMAKNSAFRIEVIHEQEHLVLRAMFDSGHSLRDSFSGAPVIVADRAALGVLCRNTEPALAAACGTPIRYIPFSSIGGNGVLPSFRPQKVLLHTTDKAVDISGVWIAVTDRLSGAEYDALIGPDITIGR